MKNNCLAYAACFLAAFSGAGYALIAVYAQERIRLIVGKGNESDAWASVWPAPILVAVLLVILASIFGLLGLFSLLQQKQGRDSRADPK